MNNDVTRDDELTIPINILSKQQQLTSYHLRCCSDSCQLVSKAGKQTVLTLRGHFSNRNLWSFSMIADFT